MKAEFKTAREMTETCRTCRGIMFMRLGVWKCRDCGQILLPSELEEERHV